MAISSIKNDNFRISDTNSMSTSERENLSNSLRRIKSNSYGIDGNLGFKLSKEGVPFGLGANLSNTSQYSKDLQTIQEAIKSGNLNITDDKGNSLNNINFNQGAMSNLNNQPDFTKEYNNNKKVFDKMNQYNKQDLNNHNTNQLNNLDLDKVREENLEKMGQSWKEYNPLTPVKDNFINNTTK